MKNNGKMKVIMARLAIAAIVLFIIAACVCMALGNTSLMIASMFCVVIVPIMIYCFIMVYDMVHKDEKQTKELLEQMTEDGTAGAVDKTESENVQ